MKKIIFTICLLLIFILTGSVFAQQQEQTASVTITASIPDTGGPPPPPPTYELVISNISATSDCDSVTVTWDTDLHTTTGGVTTIAPIVASSEVHWGVDSTAENTTTGAAGASHSVTIEGLTAGQTYKYYLFSDTGTYTDQTSESTYTLSCTVTNPSITVIPKNQGAEITVDYQGGADIARVVARRSTGSAPATINDGTGVYDGAQTAVITDNFINRGVTYYYSVFVCNSINVCSDGAFGSALRIVSSPSSLIASPANGQINLSWTNPATDASRDFTFAAARIIRSDTYMSCAAATINDGDIQVEGNFSNFNDTELTNGQFYYYKVFAKNSYGEYSNGICIMAVPVAQQEARCIANISVSAGDGFVSLNWINPRNTPDVFTLNSVQWQRDSSCVGSSGQGTNVFNGVTQGFTDNGVANDTLYSYTAFVNYNLGQIVNCGCVSAYPTSGEVPPIIDIILPPGGGQPVDIHPDFNFFVNDGGLQIQANEQNEIYVLPGYSLLINTLKDKAPKSVKNIAAQIADKSYFISLDGSQTKYQTRFLAPTVPGDYPVTIVTVYDDDSVSSQTWILKVLRYGIVSLDVRQENRIGNVEITLLKDSRLFQGFRVNNPQISDDNGLYGFMVPNGEYVINVFNPGYKSYSSGKINVRNNIINKHINLDKDQTIIETTVEILSDPENIVAVTRNVVDNPVVEDVSTTYVAPAATAVASISVITAVSWWNFAHYLQYLVGLPAILRRRKRGWGIVYNSITKEPVDLAVVRLYDFNTKKLVQSRITDSHGRYNFLVEAGKYYLEIVKPSFTFPSLILKDYNEDEKFIDLYHGEPIEIQKGREGVIIANIPLDQEDIKMTDKQILNKFFWEKVKNNLVLIGPIVAIAALIISPSLFTSILVALHALMYILYRRLAKVRRPKSWGVVYDKDSKRMLQGAVVRIFSPKYNKMLEVQVTDKKGRYGFLAGDNIYYLTGAKEGYREYKSDNIDLRGKEEGKIISEDMVLEKYGEGGKVESERPEALAKPKDTAGKEAPDSDNDMEARILSKEELEEMRNKIKQEMEHEKSALEEQAEKIKEEAVTSNGSADTAETASEEKPTKETKKE